MIEDRLPALAVRVGDEVMDHTAGLLSKATAGQPALVVRDKNTGEIDLYANGQGDNW